MHIDDASSNSNSSASSDHLRMSMLRRSGSLIQPRTLSETYNPLWFHFLPAAKAVNLRARKVRQIGGFNFFQLQNLCAHRQATWRKIFHFCHVGQGDFLAESIIEDLLGKEGPKGLCNSTPAAGNDFWTRLPYKLTFFMMKNANLDYAAALGALTAKRRFESLLLEYLYRIINEKDASNEPKKRQNRLLCFNANGDLEWKICAEILEEFDRRGYHFIVECLNNILDSGLMEFDHLFVIETGSVKTASIVKVSIGDVLEALFCNRYMKAAYESDEILRMVVVRFYLKLFNGPILSDAKNFATFVEKLEPVIDNVLHLLEEHQALQVIDLRCGSGFSRVARSKSGSSLSNSSSLAGQTVSDFWDFSQERCERLLARKDPETIDRFIKKLGIESICVLPNDEEKVKVVAGVMSNPEIILEFDEHSIVACKEYLQKPFSAYQSYYQSIRWFAANDGLKTKSDNPWELLRNFFHSNNNEIRYLKESFKGIIKSLSARAMRILSMEHQLLGADVPILSPEVVEHFAAMLKKSLEPPYNWNETANVLSVIGNHCEKLRHASILYAGMPNIHYACELPADADTVIGTQLKDSLTVLKNKEAVTQLQCRQIEKAFGHYQELSAHSEKLYAAVSAFGKFQMLMKSSCGITQESEIAAFNSERISELGQKLGMAQLFTGTGLQEQKRWLRVFWQSKEIPLVRIQGNRLCPAKHYLKETAALTKASLYAIIKESAEEQPSKEKLMQALRIIHFACETIPQVMDFVNHYDHLTSNSAAPHI